MGWPAFNLVKHAPEVVCVAIGTNLLLPVAPAIMHRFFRGIEVDPDKIIKKNFSKDIRAYIGEKSLRKIGEHVESVRRRQAEGRDAPGLGWRVADVAFAILGVFLLWSGWIDDDLVAKFCPLLFAPPMIAAGWPFLCFLCALVRFRSCIRIAKLRAQATKVVLGWLGATTGDSNITDFVVQAKEAIAGKAEKANAGEKDGAGVVANAARIAELEAELERLRAGG